MVRLHLPLLGELNGHKICPLCCKRKAKSRHHLIPRSVGGADTDDNVAIICKICHHFIHQVFSNTELKNHYSTLDAIVDTAQFQQFVAGTWKPPRRMHDWNITGKRVKWDGDRWLKHWADWYEAKNRARTRKERKMLTMLTPDDVPLS